MNDLYHTVPYPARKWTDDLDRFGGVQRPSEPLRTLAFVAKADYLRPIGPVDEAGTKADLSTFATKALNLRPRRQRGWRNTIAQLLRMHP